MTRNNVWELVKKEAECIIKAIEKGEIKTRKEFSDSLDTVYNWKIAGAVTDVVNVFISLNNIEMPWDNKTEEPTE